MNPFYNRWLGMIRRVFQRISETSPSFLVAATWTDQIKSDSAYRNDGPDARVGPTSKGLRSARGRSIPVPRRPQNLHHRRTTFAPRSSRPSGRAAARSRAQPTTWRPASSWRPSYPDDDAQRKKVIRRAAARGGRRPDPSPRALRSEKLHRGRGLTPYHPSNGAILAAAKGGAQ